MTYHGQGLKGIQTAIGEVAKSLATLSAAAMIAAKAYAKKVEQETHPEMKANPEPNTNWPS